ncbi:hypothetical protein TVAG_125080 [Trichomonas vaginalis G3]|uniref:Glycosyltransferase 2-like domain-containing protein n=1 Tax=Trichomonas vaginalis (strain ATCC PRA-98 / G3) TaxID=412133 RepID=A2EIL4_TRIV3|nr:nucleotide-diphospho-sugar transferases family [Trichomonas vaginalis G3]EAY07535.1 hypothetical protein TVAG_125080 [Trichomonas vaginalis G3]KAI5550511.1 nucleotide-diphospho-sugar transferases family [Trichomonas vaginalis G3]|eukprot:XP_001319758.1 hypothetical protein [Trichomonas vaginalis G3]
MSRRRCVERIISENSLSVEEILTENLKNCSIIFNNNFKFDKDKINEIKTVQLKDVSNINKLAKTNIQKILQITHKNETFLSIVVSGRNDNYFKGKFIDIMQRFIDVIDKSLEKVPLSRIEVVIVEYNNNSTKGLSEVLKIGKNLHGKTKIVKVSHQNHLELQKLNNFKEDFDSNQAKTIGIMKSSGKFVLVTNPDIILPINFLDYTTDDNFVDGVVYLANRIDLINTYAQKLQLDDVFDLVNSPWKLDQSENAAPFCISETFGTYVMRSINDFRQNIVCNSRDFILASKSMWNAVKGFPKKEKNKDTNARILSNFMRLANGFTLKFMNDPVIELNIDEPKPIENMPDFSPQTRKLICKGKGDFYVFNHENFEEFVL